METSLPSSAYDTEYAGGTARWVIGEPRPAIVALEREGKITGAVLDVGCGTGEQTVHLASLGYDVRGVDFSPEAIAQARANATKAGVTAHFDIDDVMTLDPATQYDTIIDTGLFHVLAPADRITYVASLARVARTGAKVYVLALADTGPDIGPKISEDDLRSVFGAGWAIEALKLSTYEGVVWEEDDETEGMDLPVGRLEMPAWLLQARRV